MMIHGEKLNKLPADKIAELELITARIVQTGLAEIIILYGSHARGDFKAGEVIETAGVSGWRRSDYDILVVIDRPDEKPKTEKFSGDSAVSEAVDSATIAIRRKLKELNLSVQVIVEQIKEINGRLNEKQYFYSDIKREGIVLYDTGKCRLVDLPEDVTPAVRRQYAEEYFKGWFRKAKSFRGQAQHAGDDKDYIMAAFDLEQVCEMCYKCILLVYTLYSPHEHDLYKLRKEAEKYEPFLQMIFPLETAAQEKLFDKLNLAYIGERYIKSFTVEADETEYWKLEVEKLMSLTEETCNSKIAALRQTEKE
ncbi:MAG: HEPN domain-containing protein [Victivallales bacterium]|nr:HEPN domain-containing protein [Victivallales bacterium]